ncbi:MAG: fibro-slime domain-containing protein [Deltaproteobacteria bacterium]|nr:fibro-slime domain-containing protein [Deltaproteobacteria bacterium]
MAQRWPVAAFAALALLGTPAGAATIALTGTIRDFCWTAIPNVCSAHPDFEVSWTGFDPGIVATTLGTDGKPVYVGGSLPNPTTSGRANFDQWYRDTAGVNTSAPLTITLDNSSSSDPRVFVYSNNFFFPIDGMLFGDQGFSHNYHFTYEIHTTFGFLGDEVFTFTGDDDLWLFINGVLAVDVGGVHLPRTATIDLSNPAVQALLGITPGNSYDFDLFFAERRRTQSNFTISTTIALVPTPEASTVSLLALAASALAPCLLRRVPRRGSPSS